MLARRFLDHDIFQKDILIVFILVFNSLAWYSTTPIIIRDLLGGLIVTDVQYFVIWSSFSLAIIASSILGSILATKVRRLDFIYLWIILGVITSALPALFSSFTVISILAISILLGFSFGLGMPSCLAYFADCILIEKRGLISGLILLVASLSAPLLAKSFETFNLLTANSLVLATWRASALLIFFLKPKKEAVSKNKVKTSFASVINNRSFRLYFVAWFMFCLVDRFEWPILEEFFGEFSYLLFMVGPIISSFFALIGGFLADRVGRKRVVLYGFITLGVAYAIIGLVPTPTISWSWYLYVAMSSISTGILWVVFLLILWGDLSQYSIREKYYAIGGIPYFLSDMIQLPLISVVQLIPETSAFSVAAFFLFLAVLPLVYAPETLSQKNLELRRLRNFAEDAKKTKEKYENKMKG
jgi:MFS family permease